MKKIFTILSFTLVLLKFAECNTSNCNIIYNSYELAKKNIVNQQFYFKDSFECSRSSWVRCVNYYSCDGKTGYMIFCTDKKEYIHQKLPINVWDSWKKAESIGSFYNKNIKNKYQMIIK